jgi:hypothetical protein
MIARYSLATEWGVAVDRLTTPPVAAIIAT